MELVQELSNVAQRVGDIIEERDALKQRVQQLELGLAEANGCIKTQDRQMVDLKDRLTAAVKDATYFREKVGVVTQAATEWSDKMVTLMKDVERKPKPMISLEDIEEKKPDQPIPIVNGPRHQITLSSQELIEIASMPEGVEFSIGPDAGLDRLQTKLWYRQKIGSVPSGYKFKPEILLKRVGDRLEFIGFRHTNPDERRLVRPESQPLPPAPNIPPAQAGSVGNDRLGGTDAIPAFLARGPANGGEHRADITDTSS